MSFLYQRTIGKIWFQLTLLHQGGNMAFCVYSLFYLNWMSFFLVTSSVALEPDWPRIKSTVEPRLNEVPRDWWNLFVISRVRYIKHLDLTNFRKTTKMFVVSRYTFNDYFTKPSIPECEQLSQYLAVYSYGIETQEQVKSYLKKITVHINVILFGLFGIHLLSHVDNYSLHRDIFYDCTSGLCSL